MSLNSRNARLEGINSTPAPKYRDYRQCQNACPVSKAPSNICPCLPVPQHRRLAGHFITEARLIVKGR